MMQPDLATNSTRFILFTVFFTARAYYPVLAILFLDLGLGLDQFVLLNLIWAATIFVFEVPSGALADTVGRRKLLIAASVLMIVEMLCLLLASLTTGLVLFALCVLNRICSGLSEACASGADQALAYDSLPVADRTGAWDRLLAKAMRWRAAGFVIAMIIGGVVYDPKTLNYLLPASFHLSPSMAHRLPVVLVLCQALVCLLVTVRMIEPPRALVQQAAGLVLRNAVRVTLSTAHGVFTHPIMLVALLIGVAIDSITRNFATLNSSYFRLIDLPEWSYGFIGAAMGALGWFVPAIATRLNTRFSMLANLGFIAAGVLIGLGAISPAWPVWGLVPAACLMMMMGFLEFTLSRTLNQQADSERRATVLSVKGLVFNLGYGLFSLGFSGLLAGFADHPAGTALRNALFWQVPYFAIVMGGLLLWAFMFLHSRGRA